MPLWLCRDLSGRLFECDCFRYWYPLLMAMTPTRTIIAMRPCHPTQPSERLPSTPYRKPRCICQPRLAITQISTAAGNMLQMLVPCSEARTTPFSPTGFTYQSAITVARPRFASVARPSRDHVDSYRKIGMTRSKAAYTDPVASWTLSWKCHSSWEEPTMSWAAG